MTDTAIGWAICIFALACLAIAAIVRDKAGEIDYLVDLALTVDAEEDAVLRMANEDRIGPATAAWLAEHGAADIDREWAEMNGRDAA